LITETSDSSPALTITRGTGVGSVTLSGGIVVGSGGLTLVNNGTGAGTFQVTTGNVTSTTTGNLTLKANSGTAITISAPSINHSGSITNSGIGTGTTTISGEVGSNVTAINQNSTTSALTISGGIVVNSGGTTLTNTAGTKILTVSGGVTGTGNLILNNNSATTEGVALSNTSSIVTVNNIGTITNSGNSTGSVSINFGIGSNVTGVYQNSATSALLLNAANIFSGGLFVTSGTASTNDAAGFSDGAITIGAGGGSANATLLTTGSLGGDYANAITVQAGSSGNTLSILGQTSSQTFSGEIALNNALTLANLTAGRTTTFSNTITGSSAITIGSGNLGTVAITGANGSSYTGATTVSAGTLAFSTHGLGDGSATITLAGGTLQYAVAANTQDVSSRLRTTGADGLKIDVNNNAVVFGTALTSANIAGSSGLTVTSTEPGGSLTLTGANTYTGLTTIGTATANTGTLKLGTGATLNSGNNVTLLAGGTFDINGNNQTLGTVTNAGNITNTGASKTLTIGNGSTGAGSFTGAMDVIWNQGATSSSLTGATGFTNTGNLTLSANGAGTIGVTKVNNFGTVTNSGAGTGSVTISGTIGGNVTGVTQNSA
ncbi:MAG: hypothetical protein NTZ46_09250, partial [Verrucomicrobia bacterium]|nr:hypothetical protein [Verrucomicrobiota bacterium]